jgi:chitinase
MLSPSRLRWFSRAVANDSTRQSFVSSIEYVYNQYHLDGIDIDWEYPGQPGDPQNYFDSKDTVNFLEFLKLLRATLPPTARISAAVQTTTFAGADGQPMVDVHAFADVLDWVLLMNYDTWGGGFCMAFLSAIPLIRLSASPTPGSNAPLADGCRNSTIPVASADAAIKAWTDAGFPLSQLVLGVPSYGYLSRSNATRLHQRDETAPPYHVHVVTDEGADSGQVEFRELVRQGVLCKDPPASPGPYVGCGGFTREWDACSSTPFLRSESEAQVITYDDEESLNLKATYARERGLLGVNIFDLHGDTDQWELVDSLRRGLGL